MSKVNSEAELKKQIRLIFKHNTHLLDEPEVKELIALTLNYGREQKIKGMEYVNTCHDCINQNEDMLEEINRLKSALNQLKKPAHKSGNYYKNNYNLNQQKDKEKL